MRKICYAFILLISFFNCENSDPTQFSEAALNDVFETLGGDQVAFREILEKYEGRTVLIDVWASWCSDCIKSMPDLKTVQDEYTDVAYVFLSLDRGQEAWKRGIEKYKVKGEHYYMLSGREGAFGEFANLSWIPRYMVVDKKGRIKLFNAIKPNDKRIKVLLK
ncbi:TlpA family protein disulfide reductase [Snuella sedimenti]|uniref:TlpA family protein disulfide reductase n=1 Tax=Snuella sedimenti TaxID=2798802 RepID=A0A8J7LUF8_9FLAO|nr:TlpA disulfide reductase family protein [Snuella sedimenti]MBJ6369705.1 TlpA family protein disulfide reductase [Snuella sedimenti]